jgi:hypothetical protein
LIKGRSGDARCRSGRAMKMVKWKAIGVGLTYVSIIARAMYLTVRPYTDLSSDVIKALMRRMN